jgi:alkylhydroperoxidase/carboxymuconolactone decarboxylase family protein YurZ
LAGQAGKRGVGFVDAPVSGGVAKAKTGQLSIMAGADAESSLERATALFDVLGVSVTRTGPVGTGHAMKALNNMLSAIGLLGASEVLAAATKFGIEPATAINVLNNSTGRNQATEVKFKPFVLSGAYNAGFAMELMVKDIGMALDLAEVEGTPRSLMASAVDSIRMIYEDLKAADPSIRRDHTEVARWVSDIAGVSFSASDRRSGYNTHHNIKEQALSDETPQDYLDGMVTKRGYVLDYHKIMANNDFSTLQAANNMIDAAYMKQRTLDRKTKEFIFIVSLIVLRAPKPQIQSHIKVALSLGATPSEILEAIEISLPEAGVVAFQTGVEIWAETVDAEKLEPNVQPL